MGGGLCPALNTAGEKMGLIALPEFFYGLWQSGLNSNLDCVPYIIYIIIYIYI